MPLRTTMRYMRGTRAHQRLKVGRLPRLIEHSCDDFITTLKLNPQHLKKDSALPKHVTVRLIRTIMIDAARTHARIPTRLSFSAAVRAIEAASLRMAAAPPWELPALYELMLDDIAREVVPTRPGRNEPRAVCRERKRYPHLRGTRAEWRERTAA